MTQWREQFKRKRKTEDPFLPILNPTLLAQPGPLHPPTQSPPQIRPSIHPPNWPVAPTHFLLANQTPFPLGNATEGTLHQLREVGLKLTEEELRQWALDMLLCPEDWRWLWEPARAPTPSISLTPPLLHPPWYDAFNANPPTTSVLNVPNTFAPSVGWLPQDIPSEPAVTIEDPPILSSSFSYADCTMLSHFSFNDLIAVAFPDLAGDLDIQI